MSKAEVTVEPLSQPKIKTDLFICTHPLNPLDVMFTNQVISYDVVNMPPVSLIQNVQMRGRYYYFENAKNVRLPVNMAYRFRN